MNYEIVEGPDIAPDGDYTERESFHDVVLVDRLRDSLQKINPALEKSLKKRFKIVANASQTSC